VIDAASNAAEINATISSKLARTVEQLLSTANRQFRDYCARHPRKNVVCICVILNSTLREWSPDVIVHSIHAKMKSGDEPRFSDIDAVLYISEKHVRFSSDGRPAHGIVIYEARAALDHPWKMQFVDRIVDEWSHLRTGAPVLKSEDRNFDVVEDVPPIMPRSDTWRLEYRRNPYLQLLPIEQLRVMFHRTIAVNSLAFAKGNWPKVDHDRIAQGTRDFTHLIEEASRRGLDIRLLDKKLMTPAEVTQVHAGLPEELIAIISKRGPSN